MEERTSYWSNIVTACCQHLLCRTIWGGAYDFSDEVHLARCDHITNARDVVEHPSNMFILDVFFPDSCDRDVKDSANAAVEEYFELVGKGFAHGPGFAPP